MGLATSRRGFLTLTLAGCAAGCAALAGCGSSEESPAPAGSAPVVQPTKTGAGWLVPGAGALTPGSAVQFMAAGKLVFVLADSNGLRALSGVCTHLGCAIEWRGVEKKFVCPCHNSAFDAGGKVLKGPAEKPLPAYQVQKQGNDALVTVKV